MYEFEAIGTHWWLERLDGGDFTKDIRNALASYTAGFDRRYSRFRDDSLVAELARTGKLLAPPEEMLTLLDLAQDFSVKTEGIFSVVVGNTLQELGYGRVDGPPLTSSTVEERARQISWRNNRVEVPKGLVLDFGGIGKGWLIDKYATILRQHGVSHFIVNGGGDLYCQATEPVEFVLEDPYDSATMIGSVKIQNGALAASSIVKRSWVQGGKRHHHIIDPRTGEPSNSDVVASFVLADTALIADVLATVLIIRPELEATLQPLYSVGIKLVRAPKNAE